jgi:pyrroloquinoline quinone biosynthesis protein B
MTQDGGFPQTGCHKPCCRDAWKYPSHRKHVSCLAIIDPKAKERWLIDATPDFKEQLNILDRIAPYEKINGIFLSHAHAGHYTGLINLGKEVMNTNLLPVYAAPKMAKYLSNNLPWKVLVKQKNIKIIVIKNSLPFKLKSRIKIKPFTVQHRDEFTETLGFRIEGPNKTVVYIPDIDKWGNRLVDIISSADRLYIDGTFYSKREIPNRNISKIPHPFIADTIELLKTLPVRERYKVHFIHLNHTNPALKINSPERKNINKQGYRVAEEGSKFLL